MGTIQNTPCYFLMILGRRPVRPAIANPALEAQTLMVPETYLRDETIAKLVGFIMFILTY